MQVVIGSDHAGYELKERLKLWLANSNKNVHVLDVGTDSVKSVDYPDFAQAIADKIRQGKASKGIAICGSGVGISIAANKFTGIFASVCHDTYSARQGVEHDNMNVLALGALVVGSALAQEIVTAFLNAQFSDGERHRRRVEKVKAIELRERS